MTTSTSSAWTSQENYMKALEQPVSGFRLGAPVGSTITWSLKSPRLSRPRSRCCASYQGLGSRAPMPDIPQGHNFFAALGDTASYHESLIKLSGMVYMPPTKIDMKQIEETGTSADSARSHDALAMIRRKIDAAFTEIDLVVVPTTRSLPR